MTLQNSNLSNICGNLCVLCIRYSNPRSLVQVWNMLLNVFNSRFYRTSWVTAMIYLFIFLKGENEKICLANYVQAHLPWKHLSIRTSTSFTTLRIDKCDRLRPKISFLTFKKWSTLCRKAFYDFLIEWVERVQRNKKY